MSVQHPENFLPIIRSLRSTYINLTVQGDESEFVEFQEEFSFKIIFFHYYLLLIDP